MATTPSTENYKNAINMTVLKSYYPSMTTIISTASFCCVYIFENDSWSKAGYEGTLFLVQLAPGTTDESNAPANYGMIVLNRLSLDNFWHALGPDAEVDLMGGYIIFRTAQGIYGLWVYDEGPRAEFYGILQRCLSSMGPMGPTKGTRSIDVNSLFRTAAK